MSPSLRSDEQRIFAHVTRCPSCGRRVLDGCPLHGPVPPDEEPSHPGVAVEALGLDGLPWRGPFPGYTRASLIARGGFGAVYRAEPQGGGRAVAIKLAHPERPEAWPSLQHEIEVLRTVGPPHVPVVYGEGTLPDGTPYVVMEYLASPTLAERLLPRARPVTLTVACALALSILRALEAVHGAGYVHRDLKPENIFIDVEGRATLVDFGLVTPVKDAAASSDDDAGGAAAGTAEYMSPEQCEGKDDVDARADLYALGVILCELTTGRPPFWGARTVVHEGHLSRRPPRLAALSDGRPIPAALEEVVARCLAKDRRDRFADGRALAAAIESALPAAQIAAAAEGPAPITGSMPATARSGAGKGDRRTVGLLFFESDADVSSVQARVVSLGGQLAHAGGGRFVAVFGQDLADNPARLALRAAEELSALGLCERVRLDLGPVTVQPRRDGTKRFLSPLFTRDDRFPRAADPPGVAFSPAAAAVLPDVPADAAGTLAGAPPAAPAPADADTELTAEINSWPLFGREAILTGLLAGARRAVLGPLPTLTTVIADPGLGKSHIFRALVQRLRAEDIAEVLDLRAREPALGDVDHTLMELLRRGLDLPDRPPPDSGRGLLGARLGPSGDLAPAVALALGWVSAAPPSTSGAPPGRAGLRPEPRAGDTEDEAMLSALRMLGAAPGALRSALTVAAGDALRRRAATRPLFVVLDDAHFASDVVLSALEYAAIAEERAPIWICALARPSFADEHPSWGERAALCETRSLGPLDMESAAILCRRLLQPVESIPDSAVRRLVERAQAIPLLLVELVRGLRREGIVRRSPKGEAWYLATDELDRLPDLPLIEWLAGGEIDTLAPPLKAHARLCALLGEHVTRADVEGVLRRLEEQGGDLEIPLDARIGTQRLADAGIVLMRGDGRIGFRHSLVREAIAHATPEALRRGIHLAAAAYYQDLAHPAVEERRRAQLAYHASEAGMAAVAERAYLDLAHRARARHAYMEAERLYSRALEQPSGEAEIDRGAAYRGRGLMRYRIGRYHDALADFSYAREMAISRGNVAAQAEILLDEATALDWMDDYRASEERVHEARTLIAGARSPLLDARLLLGLGRSVHRFSRNEEAAALLEQAAEAAEPLGEDGYETLVIALVLLGFILPGLGRLQEARHALDRVIVLCEAHGDRLHLGSALNNRGLLWGYLGDKARMVADLSRTVSLACELGQGPLELIAEFNVGETLLFMDDPTAAEPHIRRAIALDRKLSGDAALAVVALLEARLLLHRGDHQGAGAIAARLRERQAAAKTKGEAGTLMVPSHDVTCSMVELAARDAGPDEWDAIEARSERFSVGEERIEVIEARGVAAARAGRTAEARAHFERAVDMASRIPNALGTRLRRRLTALTQVD